MGYNVHFKRVSDGLISVRHYDFEWDNDSWWSEGNMACDCNRYLEFERGLGNNPEIEDIKCSNGEYKIKVISDNGEELYIED